MENGKVRTLSLALALLVSAAPVYAADVATITLDTAIKAQSSADAPRSDQRRKLDATQRTVTEVRSALMRYYTERRGWPTSVSKLTTEVDADGAVYFRGDLSTPFGTLKGTPATGPNGDYFNLSVDMPSGAQREAIAKSVASRIRGLTTTTGFSLPVTTPTSSVIARNFLMRVPADAANPSGNTMAADINMAGHWLKSANFQGSQIDVANMTVSQDVVINRDASIARNVAIGGQLSVVGPSTFTGDVTHNGNLKVNQDLAVAGNSTLNGPVTLNSTLNAKGAATFDGATTFNGASVFNSSARFRGAVVVDAATTFNQAVTSAGLWTANGKITANGGIQGSTADFNKATITGLLESGSLVVAGDAQLNGNVRVAKDVIAAGNLKAVNGDFSGTLTVTGVTTSGSVRSNNGYYVGTNNYLIADKDGVLYEKGQALSSRYLGINGKAVDADKLDGIDSSQFARQDAANVFSQTNTFNGRVDANAGVYADGKLVVSANGATLYEGGVALASKYLAINGKAADADKLDGIDSTQFARRDAANTLTGYNTFNAGINVYNGILVNGARIASNDGSVLYEGGSALSSKYLGKYDTAVNSNLLDGLDSAAFAKLAANNIFTGANTFNNDITVQGVAVMSRINTLDARVTNVNTRLNTLQNNITTLENWKANCQAYGADDARCNIPH